MLLVALPAIARLPGALFALPLLAPLPGLWRGRAYTHAWSSLLIVFYAAGFLVEAKSRPDSAPWLVLSFVAAAEFVALVLYVRFSRVDRLRSASAEWR